MTDNAQSEDKAKENENGDSKPVEVKEEAPIETQHSLKIGKKTLKYTVTTGMMPLKDAAMKEIEANVFFTAYTLDGMDDKSKRPLIFVFNGGPGSGSVWLHLGALGPKRVKMQDEGWMPAPPYQLVTNESTWLDMADLVFIDPVGTGYSRSTKDEHNKKFWSLQGDIESVGEVIRLYLTRYERWTSPLFLAGESYGTTRAAGLAGHLIERGIAFNGIMLISTILNFNTARFTQGNDLPFVLFLPTYASTAWYHGKLPDDLQSKPVREVLAEVEAWAETEYTLALAKGDRLTGAERDTVVQRLARYTGLAPHYIDQTNLRVNIHRFCKELLRDQKRTVGRLDSRFKASESLAMTEYPEFDPSLTAIVPPYNAMMSDYARRELGYKTDLPYEVLSFKVNREWSFNPGEPADTSDALRSAFARNPFMKVFVGQGYFDLATPHFAAQYTMNHSGIEPEARDNIQWAYYEAGHMMYLDVKSLAKLKADVEGFLKAAVGG